MLLMRGAVDPAEMLAMVRAIAQAAPFRHMTTPGGHRMSVAMTNCGPLGWITDTAGYRYEAHDPTTGEPWPPMPDRLADIARTLAADAGFANFAPDACLINRYEPGARMTAHQDRDERDHSHPIVSISVGLPATFFVHEGATRSGRARSVILQSGDAIVWGGEARLSYHGVRDLKPGHDADAGAFRYNLTLRRAG